MKSVESMSQEELVLESDKLRKEISVRADHLQKVCSLLYSKARKDGSELSRSFIGIASSGRRFAGSVLQGARRTEAVGKALSKDRDRVKQAKVEALARESRESSREKVAKKSPFARADPYDVFTPFEDPIQGSQGSDVDALYGEEI